MKRKIWGLVLTGFAAATALQAGSVTTCQTDTLANYRSMEGVCSVGILDFSAFSFTASQTGGATLETDSDIKITPVPNGDGGGFTIGLENPNSLVPPPFFSVDAGQSANYQIGWHFFIDPGPVGSGADLGVDPPFGDIKITQQYCLDSQFGFSDAGVFCTQDGDIRSVQSLFVTVDIPTAHIDFHPQAQVFGNVRTIIALNGTSTTGSSGFDGASGTADIFTATPEPVSVALAFAGLLGIAGYRRFKPTS